MSAVPSFGAVFMLFLFSGHEEKFFCYVKMIAKSFLFLLAFKDFYFNFLIESELVNFDQISNWRSRMKFVKLRENLENSGRKCRIKTIVPCLAFFHRWSWFSNRKTEQSRGRFGWNPVKLGTELAQTRYKPVPDEKKWLDRVVRRLFYRRSRRIADVSVSPARNRKRRRRNAIGVPLSRISADACSFHFVFLFSLFTCRFRFIRFPSARRLVKEKTPVSTVLFYRNVWCNHLISLPLPDRL